MAKVHFELKKLKNASQLIGLQGHNNRTNVNEDFSHVDPTRTYLNHDLANSNHLDLKDLVYGRIQDASLQKGENLRKRNDAVIAYAMCLGYTHRADIEARERIGLPLNGAGLPDEYSEEEGFTVREWEEESYAWLKDTFGEENVVSAMVHMDESNPHIHAIVVPITPDLRLCAKDFTGTPQKMSDLFQSYGYRMAKPPFNMEPPVKYSKGKHSSIQQFYNQMNAIDELTVPEKEREETLEAYLDRVNIYCKTLERRRLLEQQKARLELQQAKAESYGLRMDYQQAINLQQFLMCRLGTKEAAEQELLNLFQLEHYPREILTQLIDQFRSFYTIDGNLVHTKEKEVGGEVAKQITAPTAIC